MDLNTLFNEQLAKIFFHSVGFLFTPLFSFLYRIILFDTTYQFLLLFSELSESHSKCKLILSGFRACDWQACHPFQKRGRVVKGIRRTELEKKKSDVDQSC